LFIRHNTPQTGPKYTSGHSTQGSQGTNDLNIYGGDWWIANQAMERSLVFAGYEVNHSWGDGGHNGKHATEIFPEAMKWLWKDHAAGIKVGKGSPQLQEILIPGEEWELVGEGYTFNEGTATNAQGEVFFQDIPTSKTYKVDLNGKLTTLNLDAKRSSGTAFGADGKRYTVAGGAKQILSYDANGKEAIVADSISGNDITVAKNGNIYITSPDGREKPSKLYLIRPTGEKVVVDEGLKFANGLCLSPDQTQLYVTESASHWVWVYQIQADGKLAYKQRFGWLHVRDIDGMTMDSTGTIDWMMKSVSTKPVTPPYTLCTRWLNDGPHSGRIERSAAADG
jgi:sugar lactone lactonase YvrE